MRRCRDDGLAEEDDQAIYCLHRQQHLQNHPQWRIHEHLYARLSLQTRVLFRLPRSHLQSIARNFSYAPLFFDGWQQADPLERFKSCVSFAVSNCTLSISMMKPFNPILGETYQSWIGGCPLYMEQISHHPPVSSYYFQGRGYTLHGNI